MSDGSKIEWTDATWNPITGCSLVSEGCRNCYAAELAAGRLRNHPSRAGLARRNADGVAKFTGEVRFNAQWLGQPLRWSRPRRIFVCAHGDLFHESVPDEWIDRVFAVMALCPQHTFQVLTKRPERMREYVTNARRPHEIARAIIDEFMCGTIPKKLLTNETWPEFWPIEAEGDPEDPSDLFLRRWPLPNVWLGVSVEHQAMADERIPLLLDTPAAKRFISAEPLLGPLRLDELQEGLPSNAWLTWLDGLDLVIVGGESGPNARPMHPDWVRTLRDQCAAAGVPFFFKQWGAWATVYDRDADDPDWNRCPRAESSTERYLNLAGGHGFHGERVVFARRVGKAAAGHLLDGREHREIPE